MTYQLEVAASGRTFSRRCKSAREALALYKLWKTLGHRASVKLLGTGQQVSEDELRRRTLKT